jgi:hypothetical protein
MDEMDYLACLVLTEPREILVCLGSLVSQEKRVDAEIMESLVPTDSLDYLGLMVLKDLKVNLAQFPWDHSWRDQRVTVVKMVWMANEGCLELMACLDSMVYPAQGAIRAVKVSQGLMDQVDA